jgi:alanyl-tRNA synthetase
MKNINSTQLRRMYLDFFGGRKHSIIKSASVIPENDPTVLFTTAGMHPLVPYLLGQRHPEGTRLADVQGCVRTGDIDEVGDDTHCTFFEMLGNWSLGDYFKKEAIEYSFEFLTGKDYLNIDLKNLAFSVFAGDGDCPRDDESARYWEDCGVRPEKIFYLPRANNWWGPAGITGPCGPDTEIFIDTGKKPCGKGCSPACDCGKYIEIWNNVFMQYFKNADGSFLPLKQKNVDTGMGLERTVCVLNAANNVYETDLFTDAIKKITELSGKNYKDSSKTTRAFRIIADHTRTAVFLMGDANGISPGNVDQGYVLRRLIRRAVRVGRTIDIEKDFLGRVAEVFIDKYKDVYPELQHNRAKILDGLSREEQRFGETLTQGLKEFNGIAANLKGNADKAIGAAVGGTSGKGGNSVAGLGQTASDEIDGAAAFRLYDTFGFPIEMTMEMAKEKNLKVDMKGYNRAFEAHRLKSREGGEERFKGGLIDNSEQTTRLHTATHLLQAALRKVLGDKVAQRGSNITAERLRFDFSFDRPMTAEEIKRTEGLVNEAIKAAANIECFETTVDEARTLGAIGLFGDRYGARVKVYKMGGFSTEICGGPHAKNTADLGEFYIVKEQSSSQGIRRIRGELR